MKILITGANGFLGKELQEYYSSSNHEIITKTRKELDLTNFVKVQDFLKKNKFDVVVHTAVKGGKRNDIDDIDVLHKNMKMFMILESLKEQYGLMFHFGSGAEFDRQRDINNEKEESILNRLPQDYYGLSKNLITRKILESENIYNLRLFGCFGAHEEPQRLFRKCFDSIQNNTEFIIYEDRYMDYFYSQDVGKVIDFIVTNDGNLLYRDYNLCYNNKYKLTEFVKKLYDINQIQMPSTENQKQSIKNYSGDADRLQSLKINLKGINRGLKECLTKWNKF